MKTSCSEECPDAEKKNFGDVMECPARKRRNRKGRPPKSPKVIDLEDDKSDSGKDWARATKSAEAVLGTRSAIRKFVS